MSWWKSMFGSQGQTPAKAGGAESQKVGKSGTGEICQGVSPEKLNSIRQSLTEELGALPVVRTNLLNEFWTRGPVDTLSGLDPAAEAVIGKVREEARLIRQHVGNIQSLAVTIERSEGFDGVKHDGPEDHLFVKMARRFQNGGSDLIFHHVVRTGEESFKFGNRSAICNASQGRKMLR